MLSNALPEWMALERHAQAIRSTPIPALFTTDPDRFRRFSLTLPGMVLDYSRQHASDETMVLLLNLARAVQVESWRDRMFYGDLINASENRAVLHTALRRPQGDRVMTGGADVMPDIHDTLARMRRFAEAVQGGQWAGHGGKRIRTVVTIGIGGSDLGPRFVTKALSDFYNPGLSVRFVSNVDGAALRSALQGCDPATTLFLVASKTFTTAETMANARSARTWLVDALGTEDAVQRHFVALSTNMAAARDFGIAPDNVFPFSDWVGGRFSVWSAIGLSIALATSFDHFRSFLDGAYAMDRHFQTAPLPENAPVLMALLGFWNRTMMGYPALAVLPYDHRLRLFSAWLQQGDMESNGKSVSRRNEPVPYETAPVIFGTAGTDCQHSFMQMIHQGTTIVPCDFIAALEHNHPWAEQHAMLLSNMVAQADALMQGRSLAESGNDPQRAFPGNRPSSLILLDRVDPFHLGQVMALYEHKIFVQGLLWNINSFDQFGVELGKIMANQALAALHQPGASRKDSLLGVIADRLKP
ncbi:MAG: glucose-6-phosphate isomerase [Micavibrio aeruginosavorus]|nr:glucose-6-phosphate isomerase [Micavibrio aeruginosavorus]